MGIISTLYKKNGIKLVSLSEKLFSANDNPRQALENCSGWSMKLGNSGVSTINGEAGIWEQRLEAAHELAHHIFGHLDNSSLPGEVRESEARMFSCALMAVMAYFEALNEEKQAESASNAQ